MKLSGDEARAIAFVLGLVALASVARLATRPAPLALPPAAELDAGTLQRESETALESARAAARPLGADERIDVNAAAPDQLDRLPGVGPALAARIVAERQRAGAFASAADLRTVTGIGPSLLARLAPHLTFGPGDGLPPRVASPPPPTAYGPPSPAEPAAPVYPDADASSTGEPRASRGRGGRPAHPRGPAQPLDVNQATAAQFDSLPGIGAKLAEKIVAQRDSLHGFRALDDLLRVRGIGPATVQRLRPYFRP